MGTLVDFFLIPGQVWSFNQKISGDSSKRNIERPKDTPKGQLEILALARSYGGQGFSFNDVVLKLGCSPEQIRPELERLMQEDCLEVFSDDKG